MDSCWRLERCVNGQALFYYKDGVAVGSVRQFTNGRCRAHSDGYYKMFNTIDEARIGLVAYVNRNEPPYRAPWYVHGLLLLVLAFFFMILETILT